MLERERLQLLDHRGVQVAAAAPNADGVTVTKGTTVDDVVVDVGGGDASESSYWRHVVAVAEEDAGSAATPSSSEAAAPSGAGAANGSNSDEAAKSDKGDDDAQAEPMAAKVWRGCTCLLMQALFVVVCVRAAVVLRSLPLTMLGHGGAGAQQCKWLFDQATVVEALLKCPPVQAVLPTDDAARESLRQRMLADYMTHDEAHSHVDGMDGEGLPGDGMVRMRRVQQLVCVGFGLPLVF